MRGRPTTRLAALLILIGLVSASDESTEEEICVVPPSLAVKTASGLWADKLEKAGEKGGDRGVVCPSGQCMIFGDSRTDLTVGKAAGLDLPGEDSSILETRSSSKSGASIFGSMLRSGGTDFIYDGCGDYWIMYEGVNFSPSHQQSCFGLESGWSEMKYLFYRELYRAGATKRCMKIAALESTYEGDGTSVPTPGCGQSPGPIGLEMMHEPTGDGKLARVVYKIPDPNKEYLMMFCFYGYRDQASWLAASKMTKEKTPFNWMEAKQGSKVVSYFSDEKFPLLGPGSKATLRLMCDFKIVQGGEDVIQEGPSVFLMKSKRVVELSESKEMRPVQVIESKWGESRKSDSWTQERACEEMGEGCIFNKVERYIGMEDEHHGDLTVRRMMAGILKGSGGLCTESGLKAGYKGACPAECKRMFGCTEFFFPRGEGGAGVMSSYSSQEVYPNIFKEWTVVNGGGTTRHAMLSENAREMAKEFDRSNGPAEGMVAFSLERRGVISLESKGLRRVGSKGWCMTAEKGTIKVDRGTGEIERSVEPEIEMMKRLVNATSERSESIMRELKEAIEKEVMKRDEDPSRWIGVGIGAVALVMGTIQMIFLVRREACVKGRGGRKTGRVQEVWASNMTLDQRDGEVVDID